MCGSPCTWLGLDVDDFAETNRGCGQPFAVVSCAWRRERLQRPLCHRRISTCGTLLVDGDRLSSAEIAMDPNGSPGALQQEHPTNQITLHLVSPSAVCSLENRSPSSQP